jgi:predicted permease
MSLLTFDWNNIAFIGSPLATPWWAEANVMIGFIFFFCQRVIMFQSGEIVSLTD